MNILEEWVFLIQLESILGNKYSILILDKRPSE